MRLRKLRIAFSVTCLIACALLIVMWVRSYSALESWLCWSLHIQSAHGKITVFETDIPAIAVIRQLDPTFNGYSKISFNRITPSVEPRLTLAIAGTNNAIVCINYHHFCVIPFWLAVSVTAVLPIPSWIKCLWRFSLRTLLIAMTLVALVLGLIVWAVH